MMIVNCIVNNYLRSYDLTIIEGTSIRATPEKAATIARAKCDAVFVLK